MTSPFSGFTVLPVAYSPSVTHYMYGKLHKTSKTDSRSQALPPDRTLFLVNVPPDATERELSLFFKFGGTVERVIFHNDPIAEAVPDHSEDSSEDDESVDDAEDPTLDGDRPRKKRKLRRGPPPKVFPLPPTSLRKFGESGRSAHVIFLDPSSMSRALATPSKPRNWPTSDEPLGLSHYEALYDSLRPPLDAVKEHADSYMQLFEYNEAKAKQKSKYRKGKAIVDEDGFTLVTRGGAYGQTLGGGVAVATKRFQRTGEASQNPNKKKKDKTNFYAFEKAEKQRKQIVELKEKWEADKAKVAKLKESRRFKPY
ncbi:hypothetical protein FISHEDRAFT_70648 [Fistulina hepatica ATCC 64428]|uniref:RRM domain-containing protein n=1 Tax=Fistulina hepatica ATCC 64428 TaxID=1128425 RepID=A0A0D7AK48_9AGAR|nr:hypothetical protein FISHEDRAFT_70648 [Fistulina hepatica ATCC 64428]